MKLLHIDSSVRRSSVSRQLTASFVEAWTRENPEAEVIRRDLAATPFRPITDEWLQAAYQSPDKRTEQHWQILLLSENLIDELIAADIVVGSPMYNYRSPRRQRPGSIKSCGPPLA